MLLWHFYLDASKKCLNFLYLKPKLNTHTHTLIFLQYLRKFQKVSNKQKKNKNSPLKNQPNNKNNNIFKFLQKKKIQTIILFLLFVCYCSLSLSLYVLLLHFILNAYKTSTVNKQEEEEEATESK